MNNYGHFMRPALILISLAALAMNSGCNSGADDKVIRPLRAAEEGVDAVFAVARDYSVGAQSMGRLKAKYDKLSFDDNRALSQKKEKDYTFARYLCEGMASADTPAVLKSFLMRLDAGEAQNQVRAMAGSDSCITILMDLSKRKAGEDDKARIEEMAIVLPFDPSGINDFKTAAHSFDAEAFNKTVLVLKQDGTAQQVVKELKAEHLQS